MAAHKTACKYFEAQGKFRTWKPYKIGVLLVVIAGISWLVVLLQLLLFFLVRLRLIGGLLLILRFGLCLTVASGLVRLLSLCSVLAFGLLLGCLLLMRVGVPSRLRFKGFGKFMMSVSS